MKKTADAKKQIKAVAGCIAVLIIYFLMMKACSIITAAVGFSTYLPAITFNEFLYVLSAFSLITLLGIRIRPLFFRPLKRKARFYTAIVLIEALVISAVFLFSNGIGSAPALLTALTATLLIGIAEESIFRGIIAESMLRTFRNTSNGKCKAVIISSLIFGMAHITNAANAQLSGVLVQCVGAFAAGIIFTELYCSSKSIVLPVLVHAVLDLNAFLRGGLITGGSANSIISEYSPSLMIVPVILITVYIAYNILFRKPEPVYLRQRHSIQKTKAV